MAVRFVLRLGLVLGLRLGFLLNPIGVRMCTFLKLVKLTYILRVQNLICPQGIRLSPLSTLLTIFKSCGVNREDM
jgi:hypothetical protein